MKPPKPTQKPQHENTLPPLPPDTHEILPPSEDGTSRGGEVNDAARHTLHRVSESEGGVNHPTASDSPSPPIPNGTVSAAATSGADSLAPAAEGVASHGSARDDAGANLAVAGAEDDLDRYPERTDDDYLMWLVAAEEARDAGLSIPAMPPDPNAAPIEEAEQLPEFGELVEHPSRGLGVSDGCGGVWHYTTPLSLDGRNNRGLQLSPQDVRVSDNRAEITLPLRGVVPPSVTGIVALIEDRFHRPGAEMAAREVQDLPEWKTLVETRQQIAALKGEQTASRMEREELESKIRRLSDPALANPRTVRGTGAELRKLGEQAQELRAREADIEHELRLLGELEKRTSDAIMIHVRKAAHDATFYLVPMLRDDARGVLTRLLQLIAPRLPEVIKAQRIWMQANTLNVSASTVFKKALEAATKRLEQEAKEAEAETVGAGAEE